MAGEGDTGYTRDAFPVASSPVRCLNPEPKAAETWISEVTEYRPEHSPVLGQFMAEKPSNNQLWIDISSSCSHSPPNTPTESLSAYFWSAAHQTIWEIKPWQDYSVDITLALLILPHAGQTLQAAFMGRNCSQALLGGGKRAEPFWNYEDEPVFFLLKLKDKSSSSAPSSAAEQLREEVWCVRALLG